MPRVRRGITGSTQNLKKVSKGQAKKAHAKKRAGSKVTVTRGEPKKSHKSSAYRGYMTSPDWYKKRAQYFATPGLPKTCLVCGVREVDLHHPDVRAVPERGNEGSSPAVPSSSPGATQVLEEAGGWASSTLG